MFETTKKDLKDIMRDVNNGNLQLPDFQRDYVWSDEDVRSLIASIAKGYPVGALLTLVTGGEVNFKPRLLAGVQEKNVEPDELLLDGQQRITSLYQAMFGKNPVRTKTPRNTEVERYYYLDIKKTVHSDADLDDAIIGVPANKIIHTNFGRDIEIDLSTQEDEFKNDMFPLNLVFDSRDWFYAWRDYCRANNRDIYELERQFVQGAIERIERYKMPIIQLDRENSREAICLVFEKVNVGGKKLDAFELVTAIYAAEHFDLREDWNGDKTMANPGRRARMIGAPNRRDVLTQIASTDFLQSCTLLNSRDIRLAKERQGLKDKELPRISCNRDALLALPLTAYRQYADVVEQGFIDTGAFLNEMKIIWHRDVPYPPQIVALASVFAILGQKTGTTAAKHKLSQWFWSVTLGELYGSSTDSRLARDVPELVDWIIGSGPKPRSLDEALFQRDRLRTLRIRISAAYKGIHALLMQHGCRDFISGRGVDIMTFFNDKIDVHHIFPQHWCKNKGISPSVYNSIINKSPLSKLTNTKIGGNAPSVYLKRIELEHGISTSTLDDILRSHLIEPSHLRSDDFDAFFESRMNSLVVLVADAMGKPVVEEHGSNEIELEVADDVDEESIEVETLTEFATF